MNNSGHLAGRINAPGPCLVVLRWYDDHGLLLGSKRIRSTHYSLSLPAGGYRLEVEDERATHDPMRHCDGEATVQIQPGQTTTQDLTLTRGAIVSGVVRRGDRPVRFAHVHLADSRGGRREIRADGNGRFNVTGLRRGRWSLVASDSRQRWHSSPLHVHATPGTPGLAEIELDTAAASLLLTVFADGRSASARAVTAVHRGTGRCYTTTLHDGVAGFPGLIPGYYTVVVASSPGVLGQSLDLGLLAPTVMGAREIHLDPSVRIIGRVRQGTVHYAATVTLLDATGRELERVRTDQAGRFELGRGLFCGRGLTVVASSGVETLHVTRTAVADVTVGPGEVQDLGDLRLPLAGPRAVWRPRSWSPTPLMKLPVTRV